MRHALQERRGFSGAAPALRQQHFNGSALLQHSHFSSSAIQQRISIDSATCTSATCDMRWQQRSDRAQTVPCIGYLATTTTMQLISSSPSSMIHALFDSHLATGAFRPQARTFSGRLLVPHLDCLCSSPMFGHSSRPTPLLSRRTTQRDFLFFAKEE